jgi:hypothetical protein
MNLRVLVFSLFAFALTACAQGQYSSNALPGDTQTTAGHRSAVSSTLRSAQTVTTNLRLPIDLPGFIPCANGGRGDLVTLSGNLHMLATVTTTSNNLHVKLLFNPQGISGVSAITGDKYQGTGASENDLNAANPAFPLTETTINNFRIIGQGAGNNVVLHEVAKFTINANDAVTVNNDKFSTTCK